MQAEDRVIIKTIILQAEEYSLLLSDRFLQKTPKPALWVTEEQQDQPTEQASVSTFYGQLTNDPTERDLNPMDDTHFSDTFRLCVCV